MPYMWLKPDEAELIIRRRQENTPDTHAYYDYDTGKYICYNCWGKMDTIMKEVDYIPSQNGVTYTPILQCQECGRTYFGLETRIQYKQEDERPRITKQEHREQSLKEEEEYIILPSIMTV